MKETLFCTQTGRESPRRLLNFNDNWGFYRGELAGAEKADFDDGVFAAVTLPHTMRLEKNPAGNVETVFQGIGWYRRYFTLDSSFAGKQLRIDFEGVMMDCEVYLNGEKLTEHHGGYMGFSADITDKVKLGKSNVLALRVSSSDNPDTPPGKPLSDLDFHYYGGIYRNVYLRVTDNIFITDPIEAEKTAGGGVFVTYPEVSRETATVNIKTHVENKSSAPASVTVKTKILDAEGNLAAQTESTQSIADNSAEEFEQSVKIMNPALWHPETPNLYTVLSEVCTGDTLTDCIRTRIGIRRIEMKPEGFYINGEKLFLRGANRHQCYAYIGDAAPDSMQVRDAMQMRENGFNSVRAAHYPQSPAFLDACDELGILVIECQPGWQQFTETEIFYKRTIRDAREMVRRDRNHPSVFMWETSLNETNYSAEWAKEVTTAAHEEYPGDQFFTAADYGLKGEYYDVNYKGIDGGVDYCPEKTVFTREWGDRGGYRQWSRKDGEHFMLWQTETHQRFLNDGGYPDWSGLDSSERLAGYYMWSWNDYARGYNPHYLPSGCVENDRTEKYLAYWLKSMRPAEKEPMVFIASRNNRLSRKRVRVFSNCDRVELYQNKRLIGSVSRQDTPPEIDLHPVAPMDMLHTAIKRYMAKNFASSVPNILKKGGSPIYNFRLPWLLSGTLTAKAYCGDTLAAQHIVRRPKKAKKIEIIPYTRGIQPVADGSDLIPVYFKITDKNGALITDYRSEVHISVSGAGELVGGGIDRIKAEHQVPTAGVAFAFIRTSKNAGEIKISAVSRKLRGEAVVKTEPYGGEFVPCSERKAWIGGMEKFETEEFLRRDELGKDTVSTGEFVNPKNIKSITASCESEEGRGPEKILDGETLIGTGWLAKTQELPQSLTIAFKKPQTLTAIATYWEKDSSWYTFDFEVSENGKTWEKIFDEKSVGGQAISAQKFGKRYEGVKFARLTIHEVVSSGGTPRVGMAELFLFKGR